MTIFPRSHDSALRFRPQMRTDLLVERFGNEAVAWAPGWPSPVYLDPIAALMIDVIDGNATVTELRNDVSSSIGVPVEVAEAQILRVLEIYQGGRLLDLGEAPEPRPPSLFRASDPPDF